MSAANGFTGTTDEPARTGQMTGGPVDRPAAHRRWLGA